MQLPPFRGRCSRRWSSERDAVAILGAIIAGGRSSRFGSDKAEALVRGRSLLDHACEALVSQIDDLVICGRSSTNLRSLPDRPVSGLGPLGGLNAALRDALARGFTSVLTVPVDTFPLPCDLAWRFRGHGACTLRTQYLIGSWPASLAPLLDAHLLAGHRSLRSWAVACGAASIDDTVWRLRNINRRADLPE